MSVWNNVLSSSQRQHIYSDSIFIACFWSFNDFSLFLWVFKFVYQGTKCGFGTAWQGLYFMYFSVCSWFCCTTCGLCDQWSRALSFNNSYCLQCITPRFLSEPPITLHNPVIESCYAVIMELFHWGHHYTYTSTMYMIRSAASSFGKLTLKPRERKPQLRKYLM